MAKEPEQQKETHRHGQREQAGHPILYGRLAGSRTGHVLLGEGGDFFGMVPLGLLQFILRRDRGSFHLGLDGGVKAVCQGFQNRVGQRREGPARGCARGHGARRGGAEADLSENAFYIDGHCLCSIRFIGRQAWGKDPSPGRRWRPPSPLGEGGALQAAENPPKLSS